LNNMEGEKKLIDTGGDKPADEDNKDDNDANKPGK